VKLKNEEFKVIMKSLFYSFMGKLKEKRFIIAVLSSFLFFLFFFLRNHYYVNSALVVTGYFDEPVGVDAKVNWDSGDGFNEHEQSSGRFLLPQEPLEEVEHKVEIQKIPGGKCEDDSYSEIRILNISTDRDYNMELSRMYIPEKTKIDEDGHLYIISPDTSVSYSGIFNRIKITFLMNTSAGKMRIFIDGIEREVLDLYLAGVYEKTFEFNTKNVPGISTLSVSLPQYKYNAVKMEIVNPGQKFRLEGARLSTANGEFLFPVNKGDYLSELTFGDIGSKMIRVNPVLLTVQILLALFLAWIFYEFMGLPTRFKQSDWKSTVIYIFFKEQHWIFWIMFFLSSGIFSLWLLGQWPGIMTDDSLYTWRAIKIMTFDNWHPYVYSIYVLVLTQFFNSPAVVGLFQILVMSALGSYIFYFVIKSGLNVLFVIPFYIAFIFSVPVGICNIILWKDIPFSILLIFWTFYVFYLYFKKLNSLSESFSFKKVMVLSFSFIFLCIVRHNGIVSLCFFPLIIGFFRLMPKKTFIQFLISSLVLYITFQYGIANILGVHKNTNYNQLSLVSKLHPIASFIFYGFYTNDDEKDREIIEKAVSYEVIKSSYNADTIAPIIFHPSFNRSITDEEVKQINALFIRSSLENMPIFMASRCRIFFSALYRSAIYYNILKLPTRPQLINTYNLYSSPKISKLADIQDKILLESLTYKGIRGGSFIFANAGFGLLILIVIFFLYAWLPRSALFSGIILFHIAFIFLGMPSNQFRYIYPV